MFATVLRELQSPKNVGMIIRSHVAFGGGPLVFLGYESPWKFKKGTQAFSRKLEKKCEILNIDNDESFFDWCKKEKWTPVAVEITSPPTPSYGFDFPDRAALIVGHEGAGLSKEFIERCKNILTIPQVGPVGCLNVAVSCSIMMYEHNRKHSSIRAIDGSEFLVYEND